MELGEQRTDSRLGLLTADQLDRAAVNLIEAAPNLIHPDGIDVRLIFVACLVVDAREQPVSYDRALVDVELHTEFVDRFRLACPPRRERPDRVAAVGC